MRAVTQRRGTGPWEPAGLDGGRWLWVPRRPWRHPRGRGGTTYRGKRALPPDLAESNSFLPTDAGKERLGCRAVAVGHCKASGSVLWF